MANNNKSNYKKLINAGIPEKCDICGISEWNGEPIKLQVHHKDGNRFNNEIENLQILCPNCHSQTDNFCSKNRVKIPKPTCKQCGKEISRITKNNLCIECTRNIERSKSKRPSKEELIESCKQLKSYSRVSKKYNVSDKTIRKWCESYGFLIRDLK